MYKIDEAKDINKEELIKFFSENNLISNIDRINNDLEEFEFYNMYLDLNDNKYSFNEKSKYALYVIDELLSLSVLSYFRSKDIYIGYDRLDTLLLAVDIIDRIDPDYKEDYINKAIKKFYKVSEYTTNANIEMCLFINDELRQRHYGLNNVRDEINKRYDKCAPFKRVNLLKSILYTDNTIVGIPLKNLSANPNKLELVIDTIYSLDRGLGNLKIDKFYKFYLIKDLFFAVYELEADISKLEYILSRAKEIAPKAGLFSFLNGEKKKTDLEYVNTHIIDMENKLHILKK